jgi:hypothetical protein
MDNRASGVFAPVRGCKVLFGLREFGFGQHIPLLLVALALMVLIPQIASAQATATLNGVVRDTSNAVIPQATVTLHNTDNGTERQSLTNDSGLYVFVSVPPGEYILKVTKNGFTTATQAGLHVLVNQASTQDVTMRVGSTQESVTVEAAAVNLETANATLGTVIESKQVTDLPLNGRNFTQLLALTPGVSPVSVAQNSGGAQAAPVGSFVFPAVSGQSNRSNYFMLDGIDDTDQVFTTYAVAPILDDIQEFKVQSHSDEAQFGGVLGGIVNVVSKSGTNNFHGSAWEFFRNTVLDAKNPLAGVASKLEQNQFGANFGGPVILPHYNGRNKTFFFGSYEGFRRAQPSTGTTTSIAGQPSGAFYNVPTAAELNGDFSALLQGPNPVQLYNPFTTQPDPAHPGLFMRTPFPNNDISSVLNPGAVSLAKAIFPAPLPILNGFNGYDIRSNLTPQNEYSFRIDENFNPSNSLFFRYTNSDQTRIGSGGLVGETATGETFGKQYVLSYYHQFNPSTILDAQFGHVDLTNNVGNAYDKLNPTTVANNAGLASDFACGFTGITGCSIPGLSIPAYANTGATNKGGTKLTDIYQWRANLTKVLRKHSFTSGFSIETDSFYVHGGGPSETFGAAQTANPEAPAGTGDAMAAFLIGTVASASRRDTFAPVTGQRGYGFYFMDKWKVTDKLVVNVGLRYDLMLWPGYGSGPSDKTSQVGNIDFNNGTYVVQTNSPDCASAGQAPCIPGGLPQPHVVVSKNDRLYSNTYDNIQPRLGIAYSVNDKTVVRASFGMFDDIWAGVMQTVQGIGGDWPSVAQILTPALNTSNEVATANWQNPLASLGSAGLPAPTPFGQVEWYRDPKAKDPYSEQWNFGVERQLGQNTVMTANYVGSQSHRLTVGGLYNVALTPGPGKPAEVTARQPFPYISPTFYDRSIGNSSYNALQFSANHRASNGLTYLVAYTWSKSIDVGCSGFFGIESCSVQNPYNIRGDRSVSGFDLTHVLSASATVPLPFGKGKRFANSNSFVNYIVGNWQLNGILTLTSGLPYNVFISSDIPNVGNFAPWSGNVRANQVGDPNLSSPSTKEWFNTAAFAPPQNFTFGDSGRNSLRADWFKNLDMSVFRDFPLGERRSLQFRAEAFNLTNTPTWGIPVNDLNNHAQLGTINSTRSTERQLQVSLKLYF